MARPHKSGLDYFPHDTHPDKKLERFYLLYEAKGKSFWNTMLEEIYAEGWSLSVADPSTITILAKKAFITAEEWLTMLNSALKMDLFDLGFYEQQQVLTSNGIKRRWEVVAQKRIRNAEYYGRVKQKENEFRTAETGAESEDSAGFHLRAKEKESKGKDLPSEDQIPSTPESTSKVAKPGKGRAKGPRTICPESFQPSETTEAWCAKNGHPSPDRPLIDDFVNYWRGRGDLMADWQATFRNYMAGPFRLDKKEAKYGKNGSSRGHSGPYKSAGDKREEANAEFLRDLEAARSDRGADPEDVPVRAAGAAGEGLGLLAP